MPRIDLQLPGDSYSIIIESGLTHRLGESVKAAVQSQRVFLVIDSAISDTHGTIAHESLKNTGFSVATHLVHAVESQKSLDAASRIFRAMIEAKLDRTSAVIAIGGGIVGDLAGFAAATYMRGVPLIHVPTTLLAMVDASIGGKTAVNLENSQGQFIKNVVGAFWQPRAVLIDPETLRTLDARHLRCGLAECVKHALIADADLLTYIENHSKDILALRSDVVMNLIERSARIKAAIVETDERESGRRALLNLGHTFAHAIEPIAELNLLHGEAVAIGLAAATHCALHTNRMKSDQRQRVLSLLTSLGLPIMMPRSVPVTRLLDLMSHDKKFHNGRARLILPVGLGSAQVVDDVADSVIVEAWQSVGASQ